MRTVLATLHSKYVHASLALPYLAAYAGSGFGGQGHAKSGSGGQGRPASGGILIREFTVHEPKEQVLAALLAEEPEVVALAVYLWNRQASLELADALAVARPGLRVILGGPEVIADGPELFTRHPGVSALVRGEGEEPFARLLAAWEGGVEPEGVARLLWRRADGSVAIGPEGPALAELDAIPSPFAAGLVDLSRGLVYYETSRGCPYACAFCLSARDPQVRSFSPQRIESDLALLLAAEVPLVKLVDRTFNYDAARARRIWSYILRHNRSSRFHFEIGAHLLDAESLAMLATVPKGMFQFEIGVQSTLPETLDAIARRADMERLEENVRALRRTGNIPLHLDLIFGLPHEGEAACLASLDRVAALEPDHLQLEPVKLLPGAPLREQAAELGLRFDPHPPYAVLATPELDFAALERLRGVSRLLDLLCNSGRFGGFLAGLEKHCGSLSVALARIEPWWRAQGLLRTPLAQRTLYEELARFVRDELPAQLRPQLLDLLARDCARSERLVAERAPDFVDTALTAEEAAAVKRRVQQESAALRGRGIKLQYCALVFHRFPDAPGRQVRLFLYRTAEGAGLEVEEVALDADTVTDSSIHMEGQ